MFTNLGIWLHPTIKSPQGPHGTFVAGKNHRLEGMWHWSQCCHHLQKQLRLPGISGTMWHNALPKTAEILTFSMPRYAMLCLLNIICNSCRIITKSREHRNIEGVSADTSASSPQVPQDLNELPAVPCHVWSICLCVPCSPPQSSRGSCVTPGTSSKHIGHYVWYAYIDFMQCNILKT